MMPRRWSDLSARAGRKAELNALRQQLVDVLEASAERVNAVAARHAAEMTAARQAAKERERQARRRRIGG